MTDNELIILNYIKDYCKGKQHAETFGHLSLILGINERELRLCVAELVTHYQQPIASTSDAGYYWLNCDEEYQQASNELMSRIRKLSKRHKGLRNGYLISKQEVKPKQLVML